MSIRETESLPLFATHTAPALAAMPTGCFPTLTRPVLMPCSSRTTVSSPVLAVQLPGGTTTTPCGSAPARTGSRRGTPDGTYHSLTVPEPRLVRNARREFTTTPHGDFSVSSLPFTAPLCASIRVTVLLPELATHTSSALLEMPIGAAPTSMSRRSPPSGATRVTVSSPLLATQRCPAATVTPAGLSPTAIAESSEEEDDEVCDESADLSSPPLSAPPAAAAPPTASAATALTTTVRARRRGGGDGCCGTGAGAVAGGGCAPPPDGASGAVGVAAGVSRGIGAVTSDSADASGCRSAPRAASISAMHVA